MAHTESVKRRFISRRGNSVRMLFISSGGIWSYWKPANSTTDTSRAERDFRLFVQGDRRRGVQSDGVPDQLHPGVVEAPARARTSALRRLLLSRNAFYP